VSRNAKDARELSGPEFSLWVKTQLLHRRLSVTQLARRVKRHRSTVSTAIHNAERFPRVREMISEVLS
jgi:hypothetical protein